MNYFLHGFDAPDVGVLLTRVIVGVFFAISGWHKLFVPSRHDSMVATLVTDKVPFIRFNEWFVPGVELAAGIALTVGLFTPLAALLLIAICAVAGAVDGVPSIATKYHPIDKADWLDDLFYLPEVLYVAMLVVVIAAGPGHYSLDRLLF